jgi:drug/metabolite transporter (DMT)-like permease
LGLVGEVSIAAPLSSWSLLQATHTNFHVTQAPVPMTSPHRSPSFWSYAVAFALEAALVVSWSAGFVGVRFAIDYAPIFTILLWRSAVSGVLLLPFAVFHGPSMRIRDVLEQVGFGVCAMATYLACYSLAINYGAPTGIVALITDLLPLMVALLSWPMLQHRLNGRQWIGTAIGVLGVVVATNVSVHIGNTPMWVFALPILGTAAFALATLLMRNSHSRNMPVHQQLCIQCLSAAAAYVPFAWAQDGLSPVMRPEFIGGILWLAFVATFGAWGLYYMALRRFTPARVTAILYASPPLTLVWAWAMFDEPMSISILLGLFISLAGFAIFATSQKAANHA